MLAASILMIKRKAIIVAGAKKLTAADVSSRRSSAAREPALTEIGVGGVSRRGSASQAKSKHQAIGSADESLSDINAASRYLARKPAINASIGTRR